MGWFKKENEKQMRQKMVEQMAASQAVAAAHYTAPMVKQGDYVAAETILPRDPVITHPPVPEKKSSEEDMVMVDPKVREEEPEDEFGDVENRTSSFSRGTEAEDPGNFPPRYSSNSSKQNHLNSLFNGHLMKWKFAAEEGTSFIRIPACKLCIFVNHVKQCATLFV